MPQSVPSNATPKMLEWARKTAGLTLDAVANAEKLPTERIKGWENGKDTPSLAVLRRLAKRYKRPLMVFYLRELPTQFGVVKDFRRLPANVSRDFSPELRYALRVAQDRQAWAAGYLEQEGLPRNSLVGTLRESANIGQEARRLRDTLRITIADQSSCETDHEAIRLWRTRCEATGVYVFQVPRIAVEEMRGCSLPNAHAPVVLINARDAATARIFTLIHEVAHILLGNAAITGAGKYSLAPDPAVSTEKFCNQFASEVLVPRRDFVSRIPHNWRNRDDEVIRKAASTYRVSRAVIGLRLLEVGLATASYLRDKWPSLQGKPPKKKDASGGPPQYRLALSRTGESFARLVLSAYYGGEIHGGEVSSLLGMKLSHLPQLESAVYAARVQPLLGRQSP